MGLDLVTALLKITFGALAGGLTNTVAVWMLFRPYEPPSLFGRWRLGFLYGAIPKARPRLASSVGRTVGSRLLTADDLAATLAEPAFRELFDARLRSFIDDVLHRDRGSLREMLPPAVAEDLEQLLGEIAGSVADQIEGYLAMAAFEDWVEERVSSLSNRVVDDPVGGFLTPSRRLALQGTVEAWIENAVDNPGIASAVTEYIDGAAYHLLGEGRTLEEIVPKGLVAPMERVVASYLPLAADRLGQVLENRSVRSRVETTIQELLKQFLGDLRAHKRMIARLVVNEDMVSRVLEGFRTEGSQRIAEVLQEDSVQEAISSGIRNGIDDLLRRPAAEVVGTPDAPSVVQARENLAEWLTGILRSSSTREYIKGRVRSGVDGLSAKRWGEVMEYLPREKLSAGIVDLARSRATSALIRDLSHGLLRDKLLGCRIGVPARWLPDDAARRLEAAIGPPLWEWIQTQIPPAVERIDIAARVEQKVLEYPLPRLEELIRRVTHREMRLIIRLGFVLGGFVGAGLVLVEWLLG